MKLTRRRFCAATIGSVAGSCVSVPFFLPRYHVMRRPARSRVAILRAEAYGVRAYGLLLAGLRQFRIDVRGKRVLLKPNLVDYLPGNAINTHPQIVCAAIECFRELGATEVIVAEGPGHQRDTELVLTETGYKQSLLESKVRFVDLNRDDLVRTDLKASYSGLGQLYFPKTLLEADFIVSMPKMKTHHWSGVTLSMKNMFGVVPGNKYGWPKNILHWSGIQQSILDICATVPIHFVIADGIVAMEGNGPLNGTPRALGNIVLANDPVAADATCARLMGLKPNLVPHLHEASRFLGNLDATRTDQAGEPLTAPSRPFDVVPDFRFLQRI